MKPASTTQTPHPRWRSRGIALLLTLGILLLLTLLALAFSSSQLMESQAARNFYYAAKAEEMALGGLETAIAVLREDVNDNEYDHLFERWAIYRNHADKLGYPDDDGFAGDEKDDADLSDYDEFEYDVDKTGVFRDLSARRDPWKKPTPDSRWIEVLARDPTTGEERLVGRYAVCIEDESAKVNINTAGNPDPDRLVWKQRQYMGYTTAETDLGAIFENLGELFSGVFKDAARYPENVTNQTALDVVATRYGYGQQRPSDQDGVPGAKGDDNSTSNMPPNWGQKDNGIDDNGNRRIDEDDEEKDEPGEFNPYDPTEIGLPGQLLVNSKPPSGVYGNDTPYLTVPHINMAKSVSQPGKDSLRDREYKPPYPYDRLYRSLLPYITVYSQDLNRFSNRDVGQSGSMEWMLRENVASWMASDGVSKVYNFLEFLQQKNVAFMATDDRTLTRIAVNMKDFVDPDWFPTPFRLGNDICWGVEPTTYLNEVEATPPDVNASAINVEGWIKDWGEWIEIWNPYDVPLDVARYNITIDSSSGGIKRISEMRIVDPRRTTIGPPPHKRFFLIGDTRGYVENTGGTGPKGEQYELPDRPAGCDAYVPLKLDRYVRFEIRRTESLVYVIEEHDDMPIGTSAPGDNSTAQKYDPRMMEWRLENQTPGGLNAGLRSDVYSEFYLPSITARAKDPSFNTSSLNLTDLDHAGGLSNIGELGMVHRGDHFRSLNFTGESQDQDDVRLLDLLTSYYPYENEGLEELMEKYFKNLLPPFAPLVVAGRININTAPPEILLGLNWEPMFEEIEAYVARGGFGVHGMIDYLVRNRPYRNLADVARAVGEFPALRTAPEAAKEAFLRYNANLITTKSSVFKVTVLAEALDRRGSVVASRKLEAIVDRGYTPGSFGRTNEPSPSKKETKIAETARVLYFRWLTED